MANAKEMNNDNVIHSNSLKFLTYNSQGLKKEDEKEGNFQTDKK